MRVVHAYRLVFLLALAVACLMSGCCDDCICDPPKCDNECCDTLDTIPAPPYIVGEWRGIYTYKQDGGAVSIDTSQLVTFRFTASIYQEAMDTSIPDTERVFCGVLGEFTFLGDSIKLDIIDSNIPPAVCTFHQNPYGTFGIDYPDVTDDTLRMLHDSTANSVRIQKLIRLVRTM